MPTKATPIAVQHYNGSRLIRNAPQRLDAINDYLLPADRFRTRPQEWRADRPRRQRRVPTSAGIPELTTCSTRVPCRRRGCRALENPHNRRLRRPNLGSGATTRRWRGSGAAGTTDGRDRRPQRRTAFLRRPSARPPRDTRRGDRLLLPEQRRDRARHAAYVRRPPKLVRHRLSRRSTTAMANRRHHPPTTSACLWRRAFSPEPVLLPVQGGVPLGTNWSTCRSA